MGVARQEAIRAVDFPTVAMTAAMGFDRSAVMHHHAMVALVLSLLEALWSALRTRADLALENLALRQQMANPRRTSSRPRLSVSDRAF